MQLLRILRIFASLPITIREKHVWVWVGSGRRELVHRAQRPRLSLLPLSVTQFIVLLGFPLYGMALFGTYVVFYIFQYIGALSQCQYTASILY